MNGDGKRDLVLTNGGSRNVTVLLGNGDGTFASAGNYPVPGSPWSVTIADVNDDGRPDIVIVDVFSDMAVLPGNGNGTFGPAVTLNAGASPRHAVVADFNGDGKPDIAVANGDFNVAAKNYVAILINACPRPHRRLVRH